MFKTSLALYVENTMEISVSHSLHISYSGCEAMEVNDSASAVRRLGFCELDLMRKLYLNLKD